jgi:hypothetical protein
MLRNVHPNMVKIILQGLIEIPLYKYLNVTIHHQWRSLFSLNINSNFKTQNYDNSSSKTLILKVKKNYTPINLMIHNFLEAPKMMDYENTIYFIIPNEHFHPLCLFKDKHSKELRFLALFYGHP